MKFLTWQNPCLLYTSVNRINYEENGRFLGEFNDVEYYQDRIIIIEFAQEATVLIVVCLLYTSLKYVVNMLAISRNKKS